MKTLIKKLVLLTVFFSSLSAQADFTSTKVSFEGQRLDIPDGTVQILNPMIKIGSNDPAHLSSTIKTGRAICSQLGMKYVDGVERFVCRPDFYTRLYSFEEGGLTTENWYYNGRTCPSADGHYSYSFSRVTCKSSGVK